MIRYSVQGIDFFIDSDTGRLVIEPATDIAQIDNNLAIELIEILRQKLYLHKEQKEGVIKRFFK